MGDPKYIESLQHEARNVATDTPVRPGLSSVALNYAEPDGSHPRPQTAAAAGECASPAKKKQCSQPSPVRLPRPATVRFDPSVEGADGSSAPALSHDDVRALFDVDEGLSPHNSIAPNAVITPSPSGASSDVSVDDVGGTDEGGGDDNNNTPDSARPLTAKGIARAEKKAQQAANAKATATRRAKQKVVFGNNYYFDIRKTTFNPDRFKRGHGTIYTEEDIAKHDDEFQKQLSFDFSQRRASKKQKKQQTKGGLVLRLTLTWIVTKVYTMYQELLTSVAYHDIFARIWYKPRRVTASLSALRRMRRLRGNKRILQLTNDVRGLAGTQSILANRSIYASWGRSIIAPCMTRFD